MDKRYQVFISSTYEDLKAERDAVIKAVLEMGHFPVGMEMFNAADEEQWVTIQREIDRSDYYLLIVAHRYGSTIAAEGGISYTEKEFDYAVSTGVPRIGFVIDKGVSWETTFVDQGRQKKRLDQFKKKVKGRPVDFWKSRDDLATKVVLSLGKLIANTTRPGWQRGGQTTEEVMASIARLADENARLRSENSVLKLSISPTPLFEFFFTNDEGESVGSQLIMDTASTTAYEDKSRQVIDEIQILINQYNNLLGTPNEYHVDDPENENLYGYRLPAEQINGLTTFLKVYDLQNIPKFAITNLLSTQSDPNQRNTRNDIVGGRDYNKYIIYKKIDSLLSGMDGMARLYASQRNGFNYSFSCKNIGRVAAEDLTLIIKAESNLITLAGNYAQPLNLKELEETTLVDLLVPHGTRRIKSGSSTKSLTDGEVILNITALARNLPEPQEYQLKIVFDGSHTPSIAR